MRNLKLFAGVLLAASVFGTSALAADVPLKAPKLTSAFQGTYCTLQSCTGLFVGANFANNGGNFDVVGGGLSGLASNGLMLGGQTGIEFWNNQIYASSRFLGDWDVQLNAPAGTAQAFKATFTYGLVGSLGYSLASAFGAGTTQNPQIVVPTSLLQSLMTPYLNFGIIHRHDQNALASGAGFEALIATNWTLNADYLHLNYQGGTASVATPGIASTQTTENVFLLSINRHFGWIGL